MAEAASAVRPLDIGQEEAGLGPGPGRGEVQGGAGVQVTEGAGRGRGCVIRDAVWALFFLGHLGGVAYVLVMFGRQRFDADPAGSTPHFWKLSGLATAVGALLAYLWPRILTRYTEASIKVAVHSVTTYLAVMCIFCFWDRQFFAGALFGAAAVLQFLIIMATTDRLPFTMIVVHKAAVWASRVPMTMRIAYTAMLLMVAWSALWTYGVAGVIARHEDHSKWWLLLTLTVSLFWTGAVVANTVRVMVAGTLALSLTARGDLQPDAPLRPLRHALTKSFGSSCYGSLFTFPVRALRWAVRGLRAKCEGNECMFCLLSCLFGQVEVLVRFFNKYAYTQVAMHGKGYNEASRDAWELFQMTGVEALIAYDLSGAVNFCAILLGGLISGTSAGVWAYFTHPRRIIQVGATSMAVGMVLVAITLSVVESAVTSLYTFYAQDAALVARYDGPFAAELAEMLHMRLLHRARRNVHAPKKWLPDGERRNPGSLSQLSQLSGLSVEGDPTGRGAVSLGTITQAPGVLAASRGTETHTHGDQRGVVAGTLGPLEPSPFTRVRI